MSKWSRLLLLLSLVLLLGCQSNNNEANDAAAVADPPEPTATPVPVEPLAGTWQLVSWKMVQVAGPENEPYGPEPAGQIMYDGAGHMSAHVAQPDRAPFASDMFGDFTPDEAMFGLTTYIAYYGTYDLDEEAGTVTHSVMGSTFPNWAGTDQVRTYVLDGSQLTLASVEPMPGPGGGVNQILVWERVTP